MRVCGDRQVSIWANLVVMFFVLTATAPIRGLLLLPLLEKNHWMGMEACPPSKMVLLRLFPLAGAGGNEILIACG